MKRLMTLVGIIGLLTTLNGQVRFETHETTQFGPGMVYKRIVAPKVPWSLDVVEIDLTHPAVSVETAKANDQINGYETTSSMAARKSYEGHQVLAAVNGDFYGSGGIPINPQVAEGQIVRAHTTPRSNLAVTENNKPFISIIQFSGSVIKDTLTNPVHRANDIRYTDELVFYNSFYGSNTGTNEWGTEIRVELAEGSRWAVNDTLTVIAREKRMNVGSMAIPKGEGVLSGHGTSKTWLENYVSVGDTLQLILNMTPGLPNVTALMGAYPRIVKNGQNYAVQGYTEEGGPSHAPDRHPRTAGGFSEDSTKFFLVTVDGRSSHSIGMNLTQLADFLIQELGVYQAVNFDGGGSTTMIVRNEVKNTPSDGGERSVANAVLVVSSADKDTVLNTIQISPDYLRLFKGNVKALKTTGWSRHFDPLALNPEKLIYQVDERLGSINENFQFIAEGVADSGYIYVNYEGFKDSAFIYLKKIDLIRLAPDQVVTDNTRPLTLTIQAVDEDGITQDIPPTDYIFTSLNPEIGSVDSTGVFRGLAEGFCQVTARYGTLADTVTIEVQIGSGRLILDELSSVGGWTLDGLLINKESCQISFDSTRGISGDGCMRVDYAFTASNTERSYLYLKKSIPIYAVPKAIEADFKSDGYRHRIYFVVSDDNGEYFRTYVPGDQKDSTQFVTVQGLTENFGPLEAGFAFNYPIQFEEIRIRLGISEGIGVVNSGSLYFDDLRILYPDYVHTIPLDEKNMPETLTLSQNYPNPFNPVTHIRYTLPEKGHVSLILYDIRGHEIARLIDSEQGAGNYEYELDTSVLNKPLSSGIYIYRLTNGNRQISRKLLLLK
ncbi:MAG: phosphodiester glycosidase family protein [Candidatus Marinimicrobia bacterium]|nr:phosphodiester glycosidase family protein [Candidatus Neomarinimicrobiota bacterium]